MQNLTKATRRAIAFARTAANAGTPAEREAAAGKLATHCTAHNLSVADIIATAAKPEQQPRQPLTPAQQAARDAARERIDGTSEAAHKAANEATAAKQPKQRKQAEPKAQAPKPSKPADASKQREADQRVKLIGELRATVSAIYNGPSLAVRSNPRRIALSAYAELLAAPKHRTSLDRVSVRDESGLALIVRRGDKTGGFDPVALNFDAGIFSRLASVGFIAASGDGFTLTEAGLSHARKAA